MGIVEKVLILDENESNVLFFEMLLQQMEKEFKVFTASTGAQGELLAHDQKVHFVICAWEMNAMPGTVFVQRIRNNKSKRYVPCLIFSKRMKEEDIILTKELGFEEILGMPFDKGKATETIMKIIDYEENLAPEEKKIRKIEALIQEGSVTEALKMFEPSLNRKERFRSRSKSNLAEIWMQTRHYDKAEKTLDEILAEDPDYVPALRQKARLFSLQGKHEEAIAILEKMTEKSPKNIKSMLCLGSAYVDADQHDKAREVFGKVESMDGDNSDLKDEQGKLAFKEGDIPLAAQLLAETQAGNELARHFNNMAIARVAGGQFDEAVQTYNSAIQLLTDKAKLHQLHYNLGLAWKKKGDLDQSFQFMCESYLEEPGFEKAYAGIAKIAQEIKAGGQRPDAQLVEKVKECRKNFKEQNAS